MRNVARLLLLALVFTSFQALPVSADQPQGRTDRFIVVLEDGVDPYGLARWAMDATEGRVGFVYKHSINGFMIEMPPAAVNGLRNMPGVAFIEPDVEVSTAAQIESTGYDRIEADLNPAGADYSAIDIAIIDTGIWYDPAASRSHEDLNLRKVTDCTSAIFYPLFGSCVPGGVDGNGHGTHVAGIAAARDNGIGSRGIAPGATLWSFKALDDSGSGYMGSILAAVDLVAANSDQIDVANMSLSFVGESQALTDAIDAAVAQGVVFVVAAGNDSHDASLSSPASVDSAITVSSVSDYDGISGGLAAETCYPDVDDQFAVYSNFGSKVDIAAPGTCIYSTWLNDGYNTATGTSMASPTVAGAVARYLHDNSLDLTTAAEVAAVRDTLVNGGMPQNGACGFGGDTDGYAEPLLFMNGTAFGGDGTCEGDGPPVNNPPVADITHSCTDLACDFDGSGSTDDGTIVTYDWDFGDGALTTGVTTSHSYATAGTYTVTLTVTDNGGLSDTTSTQVTVTEPPVDNPPTASIAYSCTDLTCDFDGSGSTDDFGIVSYEWVFGDGDTGSGVNPSHSYAAAGTYNVSLTVTDTNGATDTDSATVTVTEPPQADIEMTAAVQFYSFDGTWATVVFYVTRTELLPIQYIPGAEATGTWTYTDRRGRLKSKVVTGISDADGLVTITTRLKGMSDLQFCITDVTKPGYAYTPSPGYSCTIGELRTSGGG